MNIAGQFRDHIQYLGYKDEISINDISQVCQGVMKPILHFLINNTKSIEDSKKIRTNILLTQSFTEPENAENNLPRLKSLLNKATENHIKITKLKSQLNLKIASQQILRTYVKKTEKFKDTLNTYRENLKEAAIVPKSYEINASSLQQISERLLYLVNENKSFNLPISAINGLSLTFNIKIQAISMFPLLVQNSENLKKELIDKVAIFNPEKEFSNYGINLKRKADKFEIENIDNDIVIDKFSKDIIEKREIFWKEFQRTENYINEILILKTKIKELFSNKKFSNPKIQEFCLLEITKDSKKAQLYSLKQSLTELEMKKSEKENQSLLSSLQKNEYSNCSLISSLSAEFCQNSLICREIVKKRLQTDEFIKKHVFSLRESLPEALKSMHNSATRELEEFLKISSLLFPSNIPHSPGILAQEMLVPLFSNRPLNSRMLALSKILETGAFESSESLINALDYFSTLGLEKFLALESPKIKINKKKIKAIDRDSIISTLKLKIKKMSKAIDGLDDEYAIWEAQPGQHVVPWRKDHRDLNLSEALELWKSSVPKY